MDRCTLVNLPLRPDPPPVPLNDALDNGQSHTGALGSTPRGQERRKLLFGLSWSRHKPSYRATLSIVTLVMARGSP